jgi:hypothetical protein
MMRDSRTREWHHMLATRALTCFFGGAACLLFSPVPIFLGLWYATWVLLILAAIGFYLAFSTLIKKQSQARRAMNGHGRLYDPS